MEVRRSQHWVRSTQKCHPTWANPYNGFCIKTQRKGKLQRFWPISAKEPLLASTQKRKLS